MRKKRNNAQQFWTSVEVSELTALLLRFKYTFIFVMLTPACSNVITNADIFKSHKIVMLKLPVKKKYTEGVKCCCLP